MSKRTHVSLAAICVAILGIAAARAEEKPADSHPLKIGINLPTVEGSMGGNTARWADW